MKNLLKLHEAIVIALLNNEDRSSTFEEIAKFIEYRKLFPLRKGKIQLAKQIMLRSTKSNQQYSHLFEQLNSSTIRLKNIDYAPIN